MHYGPTVCYMWFSIIPVVFSVALLLPLKTPKHSDTLTPSLSVSASLVNSHTYSVFTLRVRTKCFCRQFIWAHRWTTMWCSNMENGAKKNYIKNIIFVILDLSCSGGRRSTQIIKPTPKNENSIIFLLTSMWIGSCTTPTITYMFWCLNDSCSPKVLDSVQQIASDGCNSSKSFRASLTVEVMST